jgi:hypothetical protein
MNRRTFGKITLLGTLGALARAGDAKPQALSAAPKADSAGPYEPTLSSLRRHPTPDWFHDVRF